MLCTRRLGVETRKHCSLMISHVAGVGNSVLNLPQRSKRRISHSPIDSLKHSEETAPSTPRGGRDRDKRHVRQRRGPPEEKNPEA